MTGCTITIVALRAARLTDCELVWKWNFSPDVRAHSNDPRGVPYDEHARWFADRIELSSPIWIVDADDAPVGVVRLDRCPDPGPGAARISIALAPSARGRGIGRRAIALAAAAWAHPIVAEVAASNAASRACFEACGFVPSNQHGAVITYQWHPVHADPGHRVTTSTTCRSGPDLGRVGE